jgi:hypothetical protein
MLDVNTRVPSVLPIEFFWNLLRLKTTPACYHNDELVAGRSCGNVSLRAILQVLVVQQIYIAVILDTRPLVYSHSTGKSSLLR